MSFRKSIAIALSTGLLLLLAPVAKGAIFTGSCALDVTFNFDTPIRSAAFSTGQNISYNITVGAAADLNPLASGPQPCVVDTDALNPWRGTAASGDGSTIAWTCEATAASGSWDQQWFPDPPAVFGAHSIVGTNGNWVMAVNNATFTFTGAMNLTVAASDARKLSECPLSGMSSIRMTGVLYFQDPEL